jgi:hypothetical protein
MPELGVGSVPLWYAAVTEFRLEFAQLLQSNAPNGCQISLAKPIPMSAQMRSSVMALGFASRKKLYLLR